MRGMRNAAIGTLGLLLIVAASSIRAEEPASKGMKWHTDLAQARAEAEREGKPLAYVFR